MDTEEFLFPEDEWNHYNDTELLEGGLTSVSNTGLTIHMVIHCVVFVIGVPGNVLVLLIFSRCHTEAPFNMSSNALILSLAAADLGILLWYIPFYVVYEFKHLVWPFGATMCKFVFSSTHICVYASLGTMIGVAIERYLVTFHLHVSKQKVVMGMIVVWVVALLLSIPQMINLQLVPLESYHDDDETAEPIYACELVWPDPRYEKILHPIDFAVFYFLPVVIISFLYVKITSILRSAIRHNLLNQQLTAQVRKVVRVLIVVVIVFAVCNFPIHIFHLYRVFQFGKWLHVVDESPWIFSLFAALYLIPHVANPLVYAILDRKFRKEVFKILIKCKPSCPCISPPCMKRSCGMPSCRERNEEESTDRRLQLIPQSQDKCPYQVAAQRAMQCTKL